MVGELVVEWTGIFLSSPATWLATALVCLGCMLVAYCLRYLSRRKNTSSSSGFPRPGAGFSGPHARQAYGDELLVDRRLRPLYRNLKQSLNWVNEYRKKKQIGDGLNSIFTPVEFPHADSQSPREEPSQPARPQYADNAQFALQSLLRWEMLTAKDMSLFVEVCKAAEEVHFSGQGEEEYVFRAQDSAHEFLYILKQGSCVATCSNGNGGETELYSIDEGSVVASLIHFIAFLIETPCTRDVSVKCSGPCTFLRIPNPSRISGLASRVSAHNETVARLLRVLLTRLNRMTVVPAYFYLGLIYEISPIFEVVHIPEQLRQMCANGRVCRESVESIKTVVSEVLGVRPDEIPGAETLDDIIDESSGSGGNNNNNQTARSAAVILALQADVDSPSLPSPPAANSTTKKRKKTKKRNPGRMSLPAITTSVRHAPSDLDMQLHLEKPQLYRAQSAASQPHLIDELSAKLQDDLDSPARPSVLNTSGSSERLLRLLYIPAGRSLLQYEEIPSLYVVIQGTMKLAFNGMAGAPQGKLFLTRDSAGEQYELGPGSVIGQLSLVTGSSEEWYGSREGGRPILEAIAVEDTWLVKVSRSCHEFIQRNNPEALIHLSRRVVSSMPVSLKIFDFGTEFKRLNAGEVLVRAGAPSDESLWILLHGRLRATATFDAAASASRRKRLVGEYGRGTLIGDVQLLTGEPYTSTVRATRHCTLARVPESVLAYMVKRHPSVLSHLAQQVSRKQSSYAGLESLPPTARALSGGVGGSMGVLGQAKTVMIVPISGSVPLDLFTKVLKAALATCGTTVKLLTSASVSAALGLDDETSFGDMSISVSSWLQLQEEQNQMVLYQADWHDSPWNTLCGQQCDLILLVGNGTDRPQVNSAEQELYRSTKHVPKALIMLHVNPSADYAPQDTRRWVEARKGVQMQLQIRLHTHNLWYDTTHYKSDFTRLARMMTGNAVGLVLGGGGARGLAHLGLLKVLEEFNIPVDVIGGTSIGSFVGALYAEEDRYLSIFPRAVKFSRRMGNVWNYIRDLTLPITAYFHGYGFNHEIKSALGRNKKIEDLWLPYFCVTTDLTASQERIHINGTLWRYVRASMSLAGYLPPICDVDPTDQVAHYLVDGGYVNNLPADVMKEMFGVRVVIAADVSGEWVMRGHNYGDMLSGFSVFINNILPFRQTIKVPSIAEISTQLAYVSAVRQLEEAKAKYVDLYLLPPVKAFGVLDFDKFTELHQIGEKYARKHVAEWKAKLVSTEETQHFARVLFGQHVTQTLTGVHHVRSYGLIDSMSVSSTPTRREQEAEDGSNQIDETLVIDNHLVDMTESALTKSQRSASWSSLHVPS